MSPPPTSGRSRSHSASPRSGELELDFDQLAASFLRRHRFYATLLLILLIYVSYAAFYMVDARAAFKVGKSRLCSREKQAFNRLSPVVLRDAESVRQRQEIYAAYPRKGDRLETIMTLASSVNVQQYRTYAHRLAPVTVVLNYYKRESLCVQMEAIMRQSVQPAEIWVVMFGSRLEKRYRGVIASYHDPRISVVSSTYDFKFYGRFQLALEAKTKYVWIIGKPCVRVLA